MPDYPTSVPAAGWYTDPSNASQERWWGGVEWTHDVRPTPVAAPLPALQPAMAGVPGGGINPFAAIDAQDSRLGAGVYGGSPFPAPASDFASFNSFDTGLSTSAGASTVNASWYDPSRRPVPGPPPSNGLATAGLVLSLVGPSVLGIIFSIFGLRKAHEFEADGELPVGRKRARWGLGLGIASAILGIILTVTYVLVGQYVYTLYLEQVASAVVQPADENDGGYAITTTAQE